MKAEDAPATEVEARSAVTGRELVPVREPSRAAPLSRFWWWGLCGLMIVSSMTSLTLLTFVIKGVAWLLDP